MLVIPIVKLPRSTTDNIDTVFHFRTERDRPIDEYYFQLKSVCQEIGLERIPPLWVASVVPSVSIALRQLAQMRGLELHEIDRDCLFDFKLLPDISGQIGADILVLAQAAIGLVGADVIIVSAGTATVVFAMHRSWLIGGAIAPGIKGSVESLMEQAALLNPVFLDLPQAAIGCNTTQALQSGIIYGFAGFDRRPGNANA